MTSLRIEVVHAVPERYWLVELRLPAGARVEDALREARMEQQVPGLIVDPRRLAVFGRAVTPHSLLHDGDRVEILRPLLVDPKQARRERAQGSGNR